MLASELINYWLNESRSELPSWAEALLAILGIKEEKELETQPLFKSLVQGEFLSNLLSDLELTLKQISSDLIAEPNSSLKLMKVEAELFSWYYGSAESAINSGKLEYLKSNFQVVRNKSRNTTQEFINSFWLKTSTQPCWEYLSKIETFLFNVSQEYQKKQQNYLSQEQGGKKSYQYLLFQLLEAQDESLIQQNYQLGIKALFHIYKSKIKSEILDLVLQVVKTMQSAPKAISSYLTVVDGNKQKLYSLKEFSSQYNSHKEFDANYRKTIYFAQDIIVEGFDYLKLVDRGGI